MAEVTLEVGGRRYDVTCRDGEEDQLRTLAKLVDEKAATARAAVGGVNEARQLLIAALLLADDLTDLRKAKAVEAQAPADPAVAEAIDQLAARVETLADRLEERAANA
jgi:cell division protein ZapA